VNQGMNSDPEFQKLIEKVQRLEHAIDGRGGVRESIDDVALEVYGDPRRGEPGLLALVRAQVKREVERDITIRNLKWLVGALGLTSGSALFALLRSLGVFP
jgi:hypothetical protein